ncbi:MAG TPA: hypothetical protein VM425_20850 [Myxococcota bacterium]|nr:hypothetical protein [Myxococcota bacterium]
MSCFKHCRPWLFAALVFWSAAYAAGKQPVPILAVFQIENRGTTLTAQEIDILTDYLGTRLGEGGLFRIVPRDEIRARLATQKKETYKTCYDRSCQIDIGQELSAQYTLSASIGKIGSLCILTAALFDLRKAATERTATAKGPCDTDHLLSALDEAIAKLAPMAPIVTKSAAPAAQVAPPPPPAYRRPLIPRTKSAGMACLWGLLLPGGGMFYIEETGWGVGYLLATVAAAATGMGLALSTDSLMYLGIGFGSAAAIDLASIIHAMVAAGKWRDPALIQMAQAEQGHASGAPLNLGSPHGVFHPAVVVPILSGRF